MIAQTATKLREPITRFSGNLSKGLGKPARRWVQEAIYGIQARQTLPLTEIARSRGEDPPDQDGEPALAESGPARASRHSPGCAGPARVKRDPPGYALDPGSLRSGEALCEEEGVSLPGPGWQRREADGYG